MQAGIGLHFFAQFVAELVDIHVAEQFLNCFRAHHRAEPAGIFGLQLAVFIVGQQFAFLDSGHFAGIHNDESLEIENAFEIAHGDIEQVADA